MTITEVGGTAAPVAGNSLLSLMALGVGRGATVRVTATGPQARPALDALRAMIEEGFGEL